MRKDRTTTKIRHTALVVGFAILLGACGHALAESPVTSTSKPSPPSTLTPPATTIPEPASTTTTVPPVTTTTVRSPTTEPRSADDAIEVMVYLIGGPNTNPDGYDCSEVTPVMRRVEPPLLLTGAIEALLIGPTDEESSAGYDSWFSSSGWSVESVTVSDGVVRIDFSEDSPPIANASTSCGSMALRAQLDSTATQFPAVDRAVYSFGGDVAAFYGWLEADVPDA